MCTRESGSLQADGRVVAKVDGWEELLEGQGERDGVDVGVFQ